MFPEYMRLAAADRTDGLIQIPTDSSGLEESVVRTSENGERSGLAGLVRPLSLTAGATDSSGLKQPGQEIRTGPELTATAGLQGPERGTFPAPSLSPGDSQSAQNDLMWRKS